MGCLLNQSIFTRLDISTVQVENYYLPVVKISPGEAEYELGILLSFKPTTHNIILCKNRIGYG